MLHHNQTSGCYSCQNGTTKNLQTRWTCKGTGSPPPARRREQIPELTPPPLGTPTAPTGNICGAQPAEIVNLPVGYTCSHTARPCADYFEDDEDTEHDTDLDPDMLTDEG
jgi:hypothetical protein